jgi:DNA-nicking Smr family endonuclease
MGAPPRKDAPAVDQAAFEEAVRGAKPLDRRTGRMVALEAGAKPLDRRTGRLLPLEAGGGAAPDGEPALEPLERWGERYQFLAPGTDRRVARDLQRDESPPEATLDLHGMDAEAARRALRAFVDGAGLAGRRRLLVVHGRGHRSGPKGPVLRDCVLDLLASPPLAPRVLAVVNAPPPLGGLGAAVVLLRRPR